MFFWSNVFAHWVIWIWAIETIPRVSHQAFTSSHIWSTPRQKKSTWGRHKYLPKTQENCHACMRIYPKMCLYARRSTTNVKNNIKQSPSYTGIIHINSIERRLANRDIWEYLTRPHKHLIHHMEYGIYWR